MKAVYLKLVLFFLIPIFLFFGVGVFGFDFKDSMLVTLVLTAVFFWAFSIVPSYQTSLYFLFGAVIFSLAPKHIVFSGFYSGAYWLVFAGTLMGVAMKKIDLDFFFLFLRSLAYLKFKIILRFYC